MADRFPGRGRRGIEWAFVATGVTLGVCGFIVFEWFFVPPRGTLSIANPVDWLLMAPFVVAGALLAVAASELRQRRLRAASDELKDAILASISHDLRTPLTTIKALAHELNALGDERSQVIEEQADRLARYVADLLDLSRLNAGVFPVRPELNAADDLVSAVLEETAGRRAGRDLQVRLPRDGSIPFGRFDLGVSVRILANLVDNAVKYAPGATPIELEVEERDGWLAFAVLDRGPGVDSAMVPRLFERFARADAGAGDGVGLGLAMARQMAELQGGRLDYAARDGGGSAFALRLPGASVGEREGLSRTAGAFVKS